MTPGETVAWRDSLNGKRCYGNEGAYNVCGDGYGDDYLGYPPADANACIGTIVTGLRYAPSVSQRTAVAVSVVGGECFTKMRHEKLVLSDCRLPHIGVAVWGGHTSKKADLAKNIQEPCDLSSTAFAGFSRMRLIRYKDAYACVALRSGQSR